MEEAKPRSVVKVKERDSRVIGRLLKLVTEAAKKHDAEQSILEDAMLSVRTAMGLDDNYKLDLDHMVFVFKPDAPLTAAASVEKSA